MEFQFLKYPSIETADRLKYIKQIEERYSDKLFVVTEKIDGANFAVYVSKNKVQYARRTGFLKPEENFYRYQKYVYSPEHQRFLFLVQSFIRNKQNADELGYIFYGELFGANIHRRIDYGEILRWKVFDIFSIHSNRFLTFLEVNEFMNALGLADFVVPVIGVYSLKEALSFDVESLKSQVAVSDDIAEGVVIKPFNEILTLYDRPVLIKKKSERFKEKRSKPKKPTKKEVENAVIQWQEIAEKYIAKPRVYSVFSKYGVIKDKKQIGKYISLFIEDARQDLVKDYPDFDLLNKKIQKKVFKPFARQIAQMLVEFV